MGESPGGVASADGDTLGSDESPGSNGVVGRGESPGSGNWPRAGESPGRSEVVVSSDLLAGREWPGLRGKEDC